jgi:hypothetical protein
MIFFKVSIASNRLISADPFDINPSLFRLDWDIWRVWPWIGQTAEIRSLWLTFFRLFVVAKTFPNP